jgi:hypothetical protein
MGRAARAFGLLTVGFLLAGCANGASSNTIDDPVDSKKCGQREHAELHDFAGPRRDTQTPRGADYVSFTWEVDTKAEACTDQEIPYEVSLVLRDPAPPECGTSASRASVEVKEQAGFFGATRKVPRLASTNASRYDIEGTIGMAQFSVPTFAFLSVVLTMPTVGGDISEASDNACLAQLVEAPPSQMRMTYQLPK